MSVNNVDKPLPPATLESGITKEEPFNLMLNLLVANGNAEVNGARTAYEIFSPHLEGCGKVDVIELKVKYQTTDKAQDFICGIHSANTTLEKYAVAGLNGAVSVTSNAYSFGEMSEDLLIIGDLFTRQIQPASGLAMPFKLFIYASKGVRVWINAKCKFHGPRIINSSASF